MLEFQLRAATRRIETIREMAASSSADTSYRSVFESWDGRASVRSSPFRSLGEDAASGLYFSPDLLPALGHELVAQRGAVAADYLMIQRLYQYLSFTVDLEETCVVPVTSILGRGLVDLRLTDGMRLDAFKIATDEAYHSQFTYSLMDQVTKATGIRPIPPGDPWFLREYRRIAEVDDSRLRGLLPIFFAVVSETLVSKMLTELPRDQRIVSGIREVLSDHASDEGRHHVYFRWLLREVWPQLSIAEKEQLGSQIPRFIRAFLEPDIVELSVSLKAVGLSMPEIEEVVHSVHPEDVVARDVASAGAQTVKYFQEVGALDLAVVEDSFARFGLTALQS